MTRPSAEAATLRGQVLLNTISNYVGHGIAVVVGILLTPFILAHIGPTAYGLWAIVGSVIAYASLLDLGLNNAIVKYVATYRARRDLGTAESLIATAFWVYATFGIVATGIGIGLAQIVPTLLQVPAEERQTAAILVTVAGAVVGVSLPCTVPAAVLRGLQRFDLLNVLSSVGTVLSAVAQICALLVGGGVVSLAVVALFVPPVTQVLGLWLVHRAAPDLRFRWRAGQRRMLREVVTYSAPIAVNQTAIRLQDRSDEFVIGAFLPVAFVTPYSLARRVAEVAQLFSDQFTNIVMPLVSHLEAVDQRQSVRMVYLTSARISLAVFLPIGGTVGVMAATVLTLWVGPAYASAELLVRLLLVASLLNCVLLPAGSLLQGIARHRVLAYAALATGFANVLLSVVFVQVWGLVGVAVGTVLPLVLQSVLLMIPYTLRTLEIPWQMFAREVLLPAFAPAIPMMVALYVCGVLLPPTAPIVQLILESALAAAVYGGGYLALARGRIEEQLWRWLVLRSVQFAKETLWMAR